MNKQFKMYWFCVFLKGFSGIFLIINYLAGIDIVFLFKIPLILSTLILIAYHFNKKFFFGYISILFSFYLILSTIVAIYYQNLPSTRTLSHLYTIFISTFGVSFGYFFAKYYSIEIDSKVKLYMKMLFWFSFLILTVYFYAHFFSGKIAYYGFDTELPTSIAFFAGQRQFGYFGFTILLIFLSGKRSPLISTLIIGLLYFFKKINFFKPVNLFIALIVLFAITVSVTVAFKNGLLWRYESVVSVDIEDEDSFYLATSGRSVEIMGILNHMNADPIRWFIGAGLGGAYYIDIVKGDYEERYQHYAHLSLLSFIFLFGIPFVFFLLIYIIFLVYKNFIYYENKYYLGLIVTFVSSLFGAGMIVDSIFWVFLGINAFIRLAPKDSPILIIK
jgi:hypothetical protein